MEAQRGPAPDPDGVTDLAEFIGLLGLLRAWAGMPSYRTLARQVGPLMRPPTTVSPSTVVDVFKPERRRLDLDLVVAVVRALGLDGAEVMRWRDACVQAHAAGRSTAPVGVFAQLPADLPTFTGRREELGRLIAAATPTQDGTGARTVVVSAIEGMAGVGKTQLALHAAHELVRAGHFTDVQLHVNLRGFDPELPPAEPSAVLETFLRQLGVPAGQIPSGRDERAAMYRDRLSDRRALVLLDNAADEDQVRDLVPAGPSCLVLVTSRRSLAGLDGASFCSLDVFSTTEAVTLLGRIAGAERVEAEPEAAAAIAEACGHLPLAVALAAARLRSRPLWTLADLHRRLLDAGLDVLSVGNRALRPVLELSYQGLPQPTRRLLCTLGLHPGSDFDVDTAAATAGLPRAEADALLEQLQDEHLLQSATRGRYRFHDLIRGYAAELADTELTAPERNSASLRLVDWYLSGADEARRLVDPGRDHPLLGSPARPLGPGRFTDAEDALRWCDVETENLRACTQFATHAGHPDAAWRLPAVLLGYYQLRGRWDEADRTHRVALAHVRTTMPDTAVEVLLLRGLGAAANRLGRPEDAVRHFRQILELTEADTRSVDRAYAFHNLSVTATDHGRHAESADHSRQALAIFQSAGDRYGQALSHSALAFSTGALGDHESALVHGQAAFDLAGAVSSTQLQARAVLGLGETHYLRKEYRRALARYRESLELNRRVGYLQGEASAHYAIAVTHRALHERDDARAHFQQALTILRGVGANEAAIVEAALASVEAPAS